MASTSDLLGVYLLPKTYFFTDFGAYLGFRTSRLPKAFGFDFCLPYLPIHVKCRTDELMDYVLLIVNVKEECPLPLMLDSQLVVGLHTRHSQRSVYIRKLHTKVICANNGFLLLKSLANSG